jgi:hemoglobin
MNTRGIAFGVLALAVTVVGLHAQEAPAPAPAPEGKAIDDKLNITLRDVINRGREHYNNGNPAACYFMFHGALQVTQPLLEHRPELQKMIQNGLIQADAHPDIRQRAWMLRGLLDKVRLELKGEVAAGKPIERKPVGDVPKPIEKVDAKPTLWQRLGGEEAVKKVVDDFVAMAAEDEKVNVTRGGKLKLDDDKVAALKKSLVAFVSAASKGPIPYTGKNMKEAHKGMDITNAEFDAAVDVLLKALDKNGVKEEEAKELRAAVEGTRKDIVQKKDD